jgi:hypothetical protein
MGLKQKIMLAALKRTLRSAGIPDEEIAQAQEEAERLTSPGHEDELRERVEEFKRLAEEMQRHGEEEAQEDQAVHHAVQEDQDMRDMRRDR